MSDDIATIPLDLQLTVKKGARNNASDTKLHRGAKDSLRTFNKAMEEYFTNIGVIDEEGAGSGGKTAPADLAATPDPDPDLDLKALPLDKLVSAVCEAVSRLNRSSYDMPYDQYCQTAAVYPDSVIIREGLAHYKAEYTVEPKAVTIAPRADWQRVEADWNPVADDAPVEVETKSAIVTHETTKAMPQGRLGHYAILWGDTKRRDLYQEYFTSKTAEMDVIFRAIGKLPALYHHGFDDTVKTSVVGVVDTMQPDDIGLWVETQLNMADQYANALYAMAQAGKLGTSTGTLPGSRKVAPDGAIERWAIAEVSLTPSPAEPRMRLELPVSALKAAYTELGLTFPDQVANDTGAEEARQRALELEREQLALLQLTA